MSRDISSEWLHDMAPQPFGHIAIEPKPESHGSFWIDAPREGFTAWCAAVTGAPVPVDEVSDRDVQIIQRRADILATLVGIQQGRQNSAIRRAVIVGREVA